MIPTRGQAINGSRPPSLKLAGESQIIKKTTSCNVVNHHQSKPQRYGRQAPVIIYAHSPKVIHTRAEDFMALVQRLTGLGEMIRRNSNDVSESSSVVTEEVNAGDDETTEPFSEEKEQRQKLADIPLFTPSSMTLFGSPTQRLYLSPNPTEPVYPWFSSS